MGGSMRSSVVTVCVLSSSPQSSPKSYPILSCLSFFHPATRLTGLACMPFQLARTDPYYSQPLPMNNPRTISSDLGFPRSVINYDYPLSRKGYRSDIKGVVCPLVSSLAAQHTHSFTALSFLSVRLHAPSPSRSVSHPSPSSADGLPLNGSFHLRKHIFLSLASPLMFDFEPRSSLSS